MSDAVVAFGDRALRFPLPPHLDRRALLAALRATRGITDVVLAEDIGAVLLTPTTPVDAAITLVTELLTPAPAPAPAPAHAPAPAPAPHVIHVIYDGPDLPDLAARLGVTTDEVIAIHSARDYDVAMLGFMPGFAYLRGLDPRLVIERRAQPRPRVPAGSVAIAAGYTGIYPFASPGGWHILGEAVDHRPFHENAATLSVGDRVRFEPTSRGVAPAARAPVSPAAEAIMPPGRAHLEVRRALGPALVIDGGRTGHMHEGVPHGGALVPEALAAANTAAGNEASAAAIEVYGVLEVVARGGAITLADDGRGRAVLGDGEAYVVATEGRTRVRYLAVRGGMDVPVVLGGRGTMLAAGVGGYLGRALKRGDRIAGGEARADADADANANADADADAEEVVILEGPDGAGVVDAMDGVTFSVGVMSDRTGTRLEGPAMPSVQSARDRRSTPMVRGAVEMTPAGLVVLGPDHPTTGGYPVVAVVRSDGIGRLMRIPVGGRVRLVKSARKSAEKTT